MSETQRESMNSKVLKVLDGTIELLEDPEYWTKAAAARDIAGFPDACLSSDAVCWCLLGAMQRVSHERTGTFHVSTLLIAFLVERLLPQETDQHLTHAQHVAMFNDLATTSHEDVKALLTKTKEKFLEEGEDWLERRDS